MSGTMQIHTSGLNRGFAEQVDGGDALGLEFETGFQDGFEFGIVVQGDGSFGWDSCRLYFFRFACWSAILSFVRYYGQTYFKQFHFKYMSA
jgi:hypothetical protein